MVLSLNVKSQYKLKMFILLKKEEDTSSIQTVVSKYPSPSREARDQRTNAGFHGGGIWQQRPEAEK